ncbi:Protein cappuccino-like protein [Harpegnathos saltator]|uniref:Protein cappuccino-like protein n=1 Tax=Harpegnathos saltator TaxID=610380 RepID=E2BLP5_HARSA|nr:Protein cappuccino-like protein [Harpegnathos saltator]
MSSSHTTELTEQLVKDYSNYAKVNWNDEVESGSAECMQQHLPKLQHVKDSMANLRKRIDALEHVVAMANMNLNTLEAAVDKAEAELGVSDRLFSMLNPLSFFKKTQEPVASSTMPIYKSPPIYRSDDYFQRD